MGINAIVLSMNMTSNDIYKLIVVGTNWQVSYALRTWQMKETCSEKHISAFSFMAARQYHGSSRKFLRQQLQQFQPTLQIFVPWFTG